MSVTYGTWTTAFGHGSVCRHRSARNNDEDDQQGHSAQRVRQHRGPSTERNGLGRSTSHLLICMPKNMTPQKEVHPKKTKKNNSAHPIPRVPRPVVLQAKNNHSGRREMPRQNIPLAQGEYALEAQRGSKRAHLLNRVFHSLFLSSSRTPLSRTQLASKFSSSTSPPTIQSLKLTPARGPLKCTLPSRCDSAVAAWNQKLDCF